MSAASYRNFEHEIARCRDLVGLSEKLRVLVGGAMQWDDLLRSALVFGVSALDHYVHDVIVLSLVEVFDGGRQKGVGFDGLQLPATLAFDLGKAGSRYESQLICRSVVREAVSRKTYQRADDIGAGLKLICDRPFWSSTYGKGFRAERMRKELDLIVNRRNKIVHEADLSDPALGEKWPIDEALASDALDHIEIVVGDICEFARKV